MHRLNIFSNHICPNETNANNTPDPKITLSSERNQSTLSTRLLTNILDGDESKTRIKEEIMKEMAEDPVFQDGGMRHDWTLHEQRVHTMSRFHKMWSYYLTDGTDTFRRDARVELMSVFDPSWATRNGVHFGLFLQAVLGQATNEQQNKWLPNIMLLKWLGCFAMTELGHGSNVRGLETTATLDQSTDEFILESPTATSTKFWIGGAGQTATHTVVFARLIVRSVDHGVHCFLVQLRDTTTGAPKPNISIGDCGSKMGRNGIDNGWIQFQSKRIPRTNMLMKHAMVTTDGEYNRISKPQLTYGTLIQGRAMMVQDSVNVLKLALTIFVRFCCVRRQGGEDANGVELQIIDYPAVQYLCFPIVAQCYAMHFTAVYMKEIFEKLEKNLDKDDISELPDVHATSSGLKAFSTWFCHDSISKLRMAMGGLGYSSYSGLPLMANDFAVMCTWEGDNTVIAQQTAHYLLSCYAKFESGEVASLPGSVSYLCQPMEQKCSAVSWEDFLSTETILSACSYLPKVRVQRIFEKVQGYRKSQKSDHDINLLCQVENVLAAKSHCYFNYVLHFCNAIKLLQALPSNPDHASIVEVLIDLRNLFANHYMFNEAAVFLCSGYFTSDHCLYLERNIQTFIQKLRPNIVKLVDAFNLSDHIISSPLGRFDGDIYTILKQVQSSAHGNVNSIAPHWNKVAKMMRFGEDN